MASWILGGRDWNAGCGNDRQDSPGVFVRKKPIKEICREPHVSRKVVRKVIRSEATEFHYQRLTQPLPKIGPWRERLDSLLLENAEKSARERLTLVRLFEELRGFGYAGSYDAVRRDAKTWRKERGVALAQAYAAHLCSRRGLSVRRESRSRCTERRAGDREGGAYAAPPQPHAVRACLSARDPGNGL